MQETVETILLQGEDGSEVECEFGDRFRYEGDEYVILIPWIDGRKDEDGILIMKTVRDEEDPDVEYLIAVDDFDKMNEIFSWYVSELAKAHHQSV